MKPGDRIPVTPADGRPTSLTETYLGDGLFACFDGVQVTLRAQRRGGDRFVRLEPDVITELLRFLSKVHTDAAQIRFDR